MCLQLLCSDRYFELVLIIGIGILEKSLELVCVTGIDKNVIDSKSGPVPWVDIAAECSKQLLSYIPLYSSQWFPWPFTLDSDEKTNLCVKEFFVVSYQLFLGPRLCHILNSTFQLVVYLKLQANFSASLYR